jgi:hypothetical protein
MTLPSKTTRATKNLSPYTTQGRLRLDQADYQITKTNEISQKLTKTCPQHQKTRKNPKKQPN